MSERKGQQFIIKDFLAVKEAKITVKGLTTLHGDSNAGKSSILKAVRAATHNRFRTKQVRHGSEFITVKVKWDDDHRILSVIRRPTGSPTMVITDPKDPSNTLTFSKLSTTLPKEVEEFNNLGVLRVADDIYSLNFMNQFQKPLLLEYSQKKVMQILSASKGLNDWNTAHGELEERRKANRGSFSSVDAILSDTKLGLSTIKEKIRVITPLTQQLEKNYQQILIEDATETHLRELLKDLERFHLMESEEEILKEIITLSTDLKSVQTEQDNYIELSSQLVQLSSMEDRLITIEQILFDVKQLKEVSDGIEDLQEHLNNILNLEKIDVRMEVINSYIDDTKEYTNLIDVISKDKLLIDDLSYLKVCIESLEGQEKFITSRQEVNSMLKQCKDVSSEIKECETVIDQAETTKFNLESYFTSKKRILTIEDMIENKKCPTCLNVIKETHEH